MWGERCVDLAGNNVAPQASMLTQLDEDGNCLTNGQCRALLVVQQIGQDARFIDDALDLVSTEQTEEEKVMN